MRAAQSLIAACYSKACAPPPVVAACYSAACAPPSAGGTGGSLPGARRMASVATMAEVIKATARKTRFGQYIDPVNVEELMVVLRATGAAGRKPHVVSAEKFESMVADNPDAVIVRTGLPAYHETIRDRDEISLLKGGDRYGEGLYFAGGPGAVDHVKVYAETPNHEMLRAVVDYSSIADVSFLLRVGAAARQMLAGATPQEDAPTLEAAGRLAQAFRKSGVAEGAQGRRSFWIKEWRQMYPKSELPSVDSDSEAMYSPSLIAPLLGFKGFRIDRFELDLWPSGQQVDYVVILDRSALTMPG